MLSHSLCCYTVIEHMYAMKQLNKQKTNYHLKNNYKQSKQAEN